MSDKPICKEIKSKTIHVSDLKIFICQIAVSSSLYDLQPRTALRSPPRLRSFGAGIDASG